MIVPVLLWLMLQAAAAAADQTLAYVLEIIKALMPPLGAILIGCVGAYYASKAARAATAAAELSREQLATTVEMSGRLDGKLDELKKLWQSEANLQGRMDERIESAARREEEREQGKEDRAEGAASAAVAPIAPIAPIAPVLPVLPILPVEPPAVVPVETRTEAEAAAKEDTIEDR